MSVEVKQQVSSPATDLLAGAFFLVWAGVGWVAFLGNDPLRKSLFASADPGPALLPLITLWMLTIGGTVIGIKGTYRSMKETHARSAESLPRLRDHAAPLAFLASVLAAIFAMRQVGFPIAGFGLSVIWLYVLSAGMRVSLRSGLLAIVFGATMTFAVYYIFVKLLLVPLPR